MNLYILKYNSYYNRIVKYEDSLSNYLKYVVGDVYTDINFNPNDGINTTQYINCTNDQLGNYVLCVEDNTIISRWFVIEARRERSGQYKLQLRRDLLVDYYNNIVNSPSFIKKATLNTGDPFIFNSENMTYNQIKTSETLLKDATECPWIVGFIPKNSLTSDTTITATGVPSNIANYIVDNISDLDIYNLLDKPIADPDPFYKISLNAYRNISNGDILYQKTYVKYDLYNNGETSNITQKTTTDSIQPGSALIDGNIYDVFKLRYTTSMPTSVSFASVMVEATKNWQSQDVFDACNAFTGGLQESADYKKISAYFNKYIYENNSGKLYRITPTNITNETKNYVVGPNSVLGQTLDSKLVLNYGDYGNATINSNTYYQLALTQYIRTYNLELVELSGSVTINNNRYHTIDTPYDIFAMPYGEVTITKLGSTICTTSASLNQNLAVAIQTQQGADTVYDLQLLPYCPIRYLKLGKTIDIANFDVNYITDKDGNKIGVMFWANSSSFTFDIPLSINVKDVKIESECDLYRLVSPNYNGQFEFNLAKNGGVTSFNVDCTYKPYDSYIHINPNFGKLYGKDFNDARGLICGGDFSLPQVSNAWANYQLNNKNYQASFDREIQNLEVKNWAMSLQDKASLASGIIGAGAFGAKFGGPLGATAGMLGSAITGAIDYSTNEMLRNEAIDYKIDQFGYSLGNIKAMPNSLMKTSALTNNNKLFPILEYYTCTNEEKEALKNKLIYNGMTVMRIGKISEFIRNEKTYIQCQLIRCEDLQEDFHLINEIANELNKGVYI